MYRDRNQVVLQFDIEKMLPENDPVFKLVEICEQLDYSKLKKRICKMLEKIGSCNNVHSVGIWIYEKIVSFKRNRGSV